MRSKKISRQLLKNLDYAEIEHDIPNLRKYIDDLKLESPFIQNITKLIDNFPSFINVIEQSYEQYDSNLSHAQRSLEISSNEVEERNKLLRLENKKVSNLLNNMKQAVFSVNSDGVIVGPVSKHSQLVFETDIENQNIFDILYSSIEKTSEDYSCLQSAFATVFGESELQWDLMEFYFPRKIILKINDTEKNLKVTTSALWDENLNLEKIMYIIEDISELEMVTSKLEIQKEKNNRSLQIIQEIIANNCSQMKTLIFIFEEMTAECQSILEQTSWQAEDIHNIFRKLHTIKGISRAHGLSTVSQATHQLENVWSEIRNNPTGTYSSIEIQKFKNEFFPILSNIFSEYHEMMARIFLTENNTSEISKDLKKKLDGIYSVIQSKLNDFPDNFANECQYVFSELLGDSAYTSIKGFISKSIKSASADCKKNVHLEMTGYHFSLPEKTLESLREVLVHITRNAIDHGIESTPERIQSGKNEQGKIIVDLKNTNSNLIITISDDGAGIDFESIKTKSIQMGIASSDDISNWTNDDYLNVLFLPSFSTKTSASEVSGRGVGLNVVKENIKKLGGTIKVSSKFKLGTTFEISIPLEENKVAA